MTAVNPEIAALVQHQDPASDGAADHNRAVVLELARQISLVGGNATLATDAGTFAPGTEGNGNSCNESDCIYEQNRLQRLVSNDEIASYVSQCVSTRESSRSCQSHPSLTLDTLPPVTISQTVAASVAQPT